MGEARYPWSPPHHNIADPHRPLVQLERVGVDFGRQRVLRDIDLTFRAARRWP